MADPSTKAKANEFKEKGNKAFNEKKWDEAISLFTEAIKLDGTDHVFYSNRSGAYVSAGKFAEALHDSESCIQLKPDWAKGYSRKATAHYCLREYKEAIVACKKGLELEPGNAALKKSLEDTEKAQELAHQAELNQTRNIYQQLAQIFSGDVLSRVRLFPETRAFADDLEFIEKVNEIQKNPASLQKHFTDERIIKFLSLALQHESPQTPAQGQEFPTKEEPKTHKTEKKPEKKEEPHAEKKSDKRECDEWKEKGNLAYKQKNFEEAINCYTKAFELDKINMVYLTNRAAVYFEMGKFDECIKDCEEALEIGKTNRAPYELSAKAWQRIGNARAKQERYEDAIKAYNDALVYHRNPDTLGALRKTEKIWEEKQKQSYINPELSTKAKEEGNDHFKHQRYPEAVKSYEEAIKRNPSDAVNYSNKAAALTKLGAYPEAIKDCDKSIELNKNFTKAYIRKAHVHYLMKDYYKGLEVYDAGLKVDPDNQELKEGKQQTLTAISIQARQGGDDEATKRALQDPEIRAIISNPHIQQVLQDLQRDPKAASHHLSNPDIAAKIEKLIAAGVLKIG